MSKMSNLDHVLDEMITAGQKMIDAANELKEMLSEVSVEKTEVKTKTYTFEEVRGIMASLASKGKKDEARALLNKFGVNRLSEVKEDDYAALVAEAEVLTND